MSYSNASLSNCNPLHFLEQNPTLNDSLLSDCNFNRAEVLEVVKRALRASQRCQISPFYIQVVVTGKTIFLITNLNAEQSDRLVENQSSWLLGRDSTCAIAIRHLSVSRCHAVISYHPIDGVAITDVGSSNGTWVNRRRVEVRERRILRDGDLLQFGQYKVEFFLTTRQPSPSNACESTYS